MIKTALQLLSEATEELSLPKEPTAATPTGETMSATNFAPPVDSSALTQPMAIPNMPSAQTGPTTVQKEIINKQLLLAVTAELKSTIATYEKKFESEDLTVDDAKIYIVNFLESLAFHADKIANLIGEGPEVSQETQIQTTPAETEIPAESQSSELSEPVEAETPEFTNPSEAI